MQTRFAHIGSELLKPLQAEGAPILVAVSGGMDSMCLATLFLRCGFPFAVAHCNFSLRGAESDADEAFVRAWAAEAGVPFHAATFDTGTFAADSGISIEMAARTLRYRFFGALVREHGYCGVAVAHHADDNAETLLLNLLRGTGLKGITGMKPVSTLPDPDFSDIPLVRPLLGFTRGEIAAFVSAGGIPFREDRTNAGDRYKRNKIRNRVFPVFREINPSFIQTLNRDMERFAEACDRLPAISNDPSSVISGGAEKSPLPPLRYTVTEEPWDGTSGVKQPAGVLILDADVLGGAPVFGPWRSGDWIRPLGAPGRKKLQDWFTDHHIPMEEKRRAVLLRDPFDPAHVLAVVGRCIDEAVRVTPSTRRIFRITLLPEKETDG